ncbi:MAG: DUF4199 domain-containing protein [Chitinophagaceae bacterium]|nr:DUF4199 domain-containing protein [Chitinophagaceae bacterium]
MKKIVLVCGLIAGLISTSWWLGYSLVTRGKTILENGEIYGYASMILAFSLIYVGVRTYRNKYNGGVVSFGKAFLMGLYITLIASTIYVGVWLISYYTYAGNFGQLWADHVIKKAQESGASAAVIAQKKAEMADFIVMYKNPIFNILFTYMEILPVGLIVSLITAFVLKRKKI